MRVLCAVLVLGCFAAVGCDGTSNTGAKNGTSGGAGPMAKDGGTGSNSR